MAKLVECRTSKLGLGSNSVVNRFATLDLRLVAL